MPAMIDSNGKPGIGGSARGVETELTAEVVVVAVTWIVSIGVLVITVCTVLVLTVAGVDVVLEVVTGIEDVEVTMLALLVLDVALEVVVTTDVLVTTLVDVEAVVVAPPPPPPPPPVAPGGSRCKISASEVAGNAVIVVPTVRPLVLDLRKTDWNEPLFGIVGVRAVSVQLVPS